MQMQTERGLLFCGPLCIIQCYPNCILITLDVDVPKCLYLSEHHCVLVIIPASCLWGLGFESPT